MGGPLGAGPGRAGVVGGSGQELVRGGACRRGGGVSDPHRMPHHSGVDPVPSRSGGPAASGRGATAGEPAEDAVTVRYWAAARAAAGCDHDRVSAGTLASVLAAVLVLHAERPRLAPVLAICSVLVGEDPVGDRDHDRVEVPPGAFVELLPPFAGG